VKGILNKGERQAFYGKNEKTAGNCQQKRRKHDATLAGGTLTRTLRHTETHLLLHRGTLLSKKKKAYWGNAKGGARGTGEVPTSKKGGGKKKKPWNTPSNKKKVGGGMRKTDLKGVSNR